MHYHQPMQINHRFTNRRKTIPLILIQLHNTIKVNTCHFSRHSVLNGQNYCLLANQIKNNIFSLQRAVVGHCWAESLQLVLIETRTSIKGERQQKYFRDGRGKVIDDKCPIFRSYFLIEKKKCNNIHWFFFCITEDCMFRHPGRHGAEHGLSYWVALWFLFF